MTAMPNAGFHRITVQQYHRMIETGVLGEDDPVELLDGYLVKKMPHDPIHDGTVQRVNRRLNSAIPAGWEIRIQSAVTLVQSEPEPDLALVREDRSEYMSRHPGASDFGIAIEVSNTTLDFDRNEKREIYARSGLPAYWIVNVKDMQIEVFEQPSGSRYAIDRIYRRGDDVPLKLDGQLIGTIPAAELLP